MKYAAMSGTRPDRVRPWSRSGAPQPARVITKVIIGLAIGAACGAIGAAVVPPAWETASRMLSEPSGMRSPEGFWRAEQALEDQARQRRDDPMLRQPGSAGAGPDQGAQPDDHANPDGR